MLETCAVICSGSLLRSCCLEGGLEAVTARPNGREARPRAAFSIIYAESFSSFSIWEVP